jgi:hypothetical protein
VEQIHKTTSGMQSDTRELKLIMLAAEKSDLIMGLGKRERDFINDIVKLIFYTIAGLESPDG